MDENFFVIYVSLTSELPRQRNDVITIFTCLCISRHQDFFFQKWLEGVCTSSLSCLDYGKVLTNSKGSFWKYFEKKF